MRRFLNYLLAFTFVLSCFFFTLPKSYADVGGICAAGNDKYSHGYSLTGYGATDIVAVAQAQVGKTQSDLGYYGAWCAAFINDCAYLANQAAAIPFVSGSTHDVSGLRNHVLSSGGQTVTSPQAGDLVFYYISSLGYVHVGLMIDSSQTIQGNLYDRNGNGPFVQLLDSPWRYKNGNYEYSVSYIRPHYTDRVTGILDLNGLLDGWQEGGLLDFGTCDVYINGSLAADRTNTTDYVDSLPAGTTYSITNIKANEGFSYDGLAPGSAPLSGTIQSGVTTDVRLKFNSCKLDVNGWLDNEECGTLLDYGTFDLYVNGVKIKDDTDDFWDRLPKGASYEIKDIKAAPGHVYNGPYSGSLTGTIVSGRINVVLSFSTTGEISSEWITVAKLPGNINSTICDIEYKNTYQTTAQSSPGSGWSQVPGSGITTYENVGAVEETVFAKTESETCELVGRYYYHFCGPSAYGAEYYQTGGYINRHVAGSPDQYDVVGTFEDSNLHSSLYQYQLRNKYGQWAGQPSLCSDERTDRWYLMYQYQNKRAVTTYTWSKDSDWTTTADSTATSVQYRYRLKSSLTKLDLPANLTVIEDEAFAGAVMNAVIVPDSCTAIGSKAFANCSELVFVSVPKGTTIAADAFEGCGSVTVNER